MPDRKPLAPGHYAELYGLTFTEHELMLLNTVDRGLLTPIQRQEQYILGLALQPLRCPGCGGVTCRRAAYTGQDFTAGHEPVPDDAYACQICHVRLEWHLALIGGDQWFTLAPGQTVTIPDRRRTP